MLEITTKPAGAQTQFLPKPGAVSFKRVLGCWRRGFGTLPPARWAPGRPRGRNAPETDPRPDLRLLSWPLCQLNEDRRNKLPHHIPQLKILS